jgi:hypothetical protein
VKGFGQRVEGEKENGDFQSLPHNDAFVTSRRSGERWQTKDTCLCYLCKPHKNREANKENRTKTKATLGWKLGNRWMADLEDLKKPSPQLVPGTFGRG